MKRYGQFCPIAKAAEIFCERWTALVLRDLAYGASHFNELQRGVPLMSPTLLSRRLRQLEQEGVVERRAAPQGRGHSYHLTAAGREFVPLVELLGAWGQRWTRRTLADGEIDLGLALWWLQRTVHPGAFGAPRAVVQLELTDQPAAKRRWWLVNEDARAQLCVSDPGFEVDLYLSTTLPNLVYLLRGDLPLEQAIESGRLNASGPARTRRALRGWLNLGPLTRIESQRDDAPQFERTARSARGPWQRR